MLLFVTTNNPATPNLKKILMKHWHIIQQQSRLAHRLHLTGRKKSLKDVLVREKFQSITPQSLTVVNKKALLKSLFSSQKEIYV